MEVAGTRSLLLNEGQAVHSVYTPGQAASYGTWDYFLAAPFFNSPPIASAPIGRVGLIGLAAGTISKQYSLVFGPVPIDGWEIDPEIIEVGREFFDMNEPNLNVIVSDGRLGLARSDHLYSVIGVDAYQPPYIPWHMTTKEFFEEVRDHLTSTGVMVINVGRTHTDRRLVDAIVGTASSVFPSIHVVDVPATFNTIVYATVRRTTPTNLARNLAGLRDAGAHPLLVDVLERSVANLQPTPDSQVVFTDDRAPVERLVDSIVIQFLLSDEFDLLPSAVPAQ